MAITLKRQLNDYEKQTILQRHGRICFATGHPMPIEVSGRMSQTTIQVPQEHKGRHVR